MAPKQRSFTQTVDLLARPGLALSALAMLGVAAYAWWDGHLLSPVRIVLFVVLPTIFALLAAYATIASASRRWQVIINLGVVVIALLAFELHLRASEQFFPPPDTPAKKKLSLKYLPQVCSTSVRKTTLLLPDGKPVVPLGGVSKSEILWKGYTLWTDRYGFKNPDFAWDAPDGTTLFVGDSFTYGGNARPEAGFVELIRKRGIPSINLGCGGNGPLAELGTVIEYAPATKPGRIVWVYYEGNDLTKDIWRELKAPLLAGYLEGERQNLRDKQRDIDVALLPFIEERRQEAMEKQKKKQRKSPPSHLTDWRGILGLTFIRGSMGLNYGYQPRALEIFGKALDRTAAIAAQLNAELLFVYLPGEDRYRTFFGATDAGGYAAAVMQRAEAAGFRVVDIDVALRNTGREPLSFYAGHLNDDGHAAVADAIEAALREEPGRRR